MSQKEINCPCIRHTGMMITSISDVLSYDLNTEVNNEHIHGKISLERNLTCMTLVKGETTVAISFSLTLHVCMINLYSLNHIFIIRLNENIAVIIFFIIVS